MSTRILPPWVSTDGNSPIETPLWENVRAAPSFNEHTDYRLLLLHEDGTVWCYYVYKMNKSTLYFVDYTIDSSVYIAVHSQSIHKYEYVLRHNNVSAAMASDGRVLPYRPICGFQRRPRLWYASASPISEVQRVINYRQDNIEKALIIGYIRESGFDEVILEELICGFLLGFATFSYPSSINLRENEHRSSFVDLKQTLVVWADEMSDAKWSQLRMDDISFYGLDSEYRVSVENSSTRLYGHTNDSFRVHMLTQEFLIIKSGGELYRVPRDRKSGATRIIVTKNFSFEDVTHPIIKPCFVSKRSDDDRNHAKMIAYAGRIGETRTVNLLLNRLRASINQRNTSERRTALLEGIKYRRKFFVLKLLERKDIDINLQDKQEDSPLNAACKLGMKKVVSALCRRSELNINSKDSHGRTALMNAVRGGMGSIIRSLLQWEDTDVNDKCDQGLTALMYACSFGRASRSESMQRKACELILRDDRVLVNATNKKGRSALHLAVRSNFQFGVDALLHHRQIDPNMRDDEGYTPLMNASATGKLELIQLMTQHERIDVNVVDKYGFNAHRVAKVNGREDIVEYLNNFAHHATQVGRQSTVESFEHRSVEMDLKNRTHRGDGCVLM